MKIILLTIVLPTLILFFFLEPGCKRMVFQDPAEKTTG